MNRKLLYILLLTGIFPLLSFSQTNNDCMKKVHELYKLGKYDDAIIAVDMAIKINPNNYEGYSYRGFVNNKRRGYTSAINNYTKVIEINPNYSGAYNGRGDAYNKL